MPKILNVILMLCVFVHGHCSVWKLDWSCIRFFFFFFTKKLWLLQWKPQAVTKKTSGWTVFKNIWNEIEHSKSRYGKKIKFDHVVSTTASVGELFSTECRTNMTLKSKQFQKTENISHASIHQTILLLVYLFSFLRMEKTGRDVTSNTFSHCLWHFVLNKRSVAKVWRVPAYNYR